MRSFQVPSELLQRRLDPDLCTGHLILAIDFVMSSLRKCLSPIIWVKLCIFREWQIFGGEHFVTRDELPWFGSLHELEVLRPAAGDGQAHARYAEQPTHSKIEPIHVS